MPIIAERYIPDFIFWFSLTIKDKSYPGSFWARFMFVGYFNNLGQ
jgi:hypothetical protein